MANQIDMTETFIRKSNLPPQLCFDSGYPLKPELERIREDIMRETYSHSIMVFSGPGVGKTISAATLMRSWIDTRKFIVEASTPGYFVSVRQLCYQNRSVDRYNRDEGLQEALRIASTTDFLILDGLFSYLTQNDDLMLQAIYDSRQHSGRTTIVTTDIVDPFDCAGSILYRITRDARVKVVF